MFFNFKNIEFCLKSFKNNFPFDHCIIDGFLNNTFASILESEFLDYEDTRWYSYRNALENKKALNDWNLFPSNTYKVMRELISDKFIQLLSDTLGIPLYQDPGLHGGGWHIHGQGGNLNPHFDYSIHPKVYLQRKLNLIIYLSSELTYEHGGNLGFWTHDFEKNAPANLVKEIQPQFNRAVIFDTTQNSWHGMSTPLNQPEGIYRKSLAIYYLTEPPANADKRQRALYAAREDQKGNKLIEELIRKRSDVKDFSTVYRTDN